MPELDDLPQKLRATGCPEANVEELRAILSEAASMRIGGATEQAGAKHREAVLEHFHRLQPPTQYEIAQAQAIEATYGTPIMEGLTPEHRSHRLSRDRVWSLSAYLEGQRPGLGHEITSFVLNATEGQDDPYDIKSQVMLAAQWSVIGDLAAVPIIEWRTTNTHLDVPGYMKNPVSPLIEVFSDGYAIDWYEWRFTNNDGDDLGRLPVLPETMRTDHADELGMSPQNHDYVGVGLPYPSHSPLAVRVLVWTVFLPVTVFALIPIPSAPGAQHTLGMALLGGMAYLSVPALVGGLITTTWWLVGVSLYLLAGQYVVGNYLLRTRMRQ